ncbi:glycoside hydrolase family 43 protein [Hymenobacter sp. GOD-10R]|uniref:glycoside hydrolase family 43 protein n=1 Tax=Hymenobacter sp. GOD-10R TaxID=3093922 RepID=UPI002D791192|nr:glycoside hydrolase family 43 protein [Hymenobacter sp. GOD-10R]WRQ27764.1 glycoside hydrolase family 43 protein [Hymenobacter sp. GOD-10R]
MAIFSSSWRLLAVALLLTTAACKDSGGGSAPAPAPPTPAPAAATFTNPLLPSGPDPWVYQKDGFYYYMQTTGNNLVIRKTAKVSELGSAVSTIIWTPPSNGGNSRNIWAPELHFLDGKWYVYFTAGPGADAGQRTWVLENPAADPTTGTWTEKGRVYNPTEDYWAIDGTVLEQNGKRYFLWSGWPAGSGGEQRLYISEMSNPWTLIGPRIELSRPQYAWEKNGFGVNEGPEILKHGDKTYVVYSASFCGTDDYALGLLTATATADPLTPTTWTKTATPVFVKSNGAYGPGHNAFFKSKDGAEDWIIYHANNSAGQGCGDVRNPRIQKFTWNTDGTPNFGVPAAINTALPRPSGE